MREGDNEALRGGAVWPGAISSHVFFDRRLGAHFLVDDHSAAFPKNPSTGNFSPDSLHKNASTGYFQRQGASAEM
jgi:hypothetical protein